MIGIYKIISPSNKIYVGQSTDIEKRFKGYKKLYCKKQVKLYNSLKKYGVENHKFEIIEECSLEELDKQETYWKQQYNTVENGLNCSYYDFSPMKGNIHNDHTKRKISQSKIGHICYKDPERGRKISQSNKGKKHSEEACLKKSQANKGRPKPKGFGEIISKNKKGVSLGKMSKEHKNKISKSLLGRFSKPIIQYDKQNNFIKEWSSIREANISLGKSPDGGSIPTHLKGKLKQAYGFIWEYK